MSLLLKKTGHFYHVAVSILRERHIFQRSSFACVMLKAGHVTVIIINYRSLILLVLYYHLALK